MILTPLLILCCFTGFVHNQNISSDLRPWQSYLQLGQIQRPLGITLNYSDPVDQHFNVGYLALHSFMYDEARDSFSIAIALRPTFIEAHIGKMLTCKQALWSYTDFLCGQMAYEAAVNATNSSNMTSLQQSLFNTVYLWYSNQTSTDYGETAFLASIRNVFDAYPNETDIQVLKALSLLNVADQIQYQSVMEPAYMIEAREVLKNVTEKEPNHPGALHYLIHAYDVVMVNVSEQARIYAFRYGNIVNTSSHGQHMPAHIWMRTGSWTLAVNADRNGILSSLSLCATKLFNRIVIANSTQLDATLSSATGVNQSLSLLQCDAENRAHSMEWIAYSRLQRGDWNGSVSILRDLFTSHQGYANISSHYLPFAYRTQARTIVESFFWFPYRAQFLDRTNQLLALNGTQTLISVSDNVTRSYPMWSEAGLRMSECLRLLVSPNNSFNSTTIDDHLNRIAVLANRTSGLNQYVSKSISMMIPQIRGIRAYINQSWQEALNYLNDAVQIELQVTADANSPTLIFARSSELLALHLLLMYDNYQQQSTRALAPLYSINGTNVSVATFPSRALSLYQTANSTAPNRAISTLGMARSYTKLQNNAEASRLYGLLLAQMSNSDTTDTSLLQEINSLQSQVLVPSNCAIHPPMLFVLICMCSLLAFL